MKSFAFTFGALATLVAAQDTGSLPECGIICAEDMLSGQTAGIGCDERDLQCLCQDVNFIYGLRDCSAATCGGEDSRRIVEFGIEICRGAGVEITTGPGGVPTPTNTGDSEDDATSASGSVSTILTTISSDETTITTPIATTTVGAGAGVTTGTDGETTPVSTPATSSDDEDLVSTITTDGSTLVTTFSSTSTGDDASETSDGGDSDGGDATTTGDDEGVAMPQRTMAPAIVLAAGLAGFLL